MIDLDEFRGQTSKERKLKAARYVARMGRAPIDPDSSDTEAIDFLVYLYREVADADEYYERFDSDTIREIADNAVPYNDYKAAMAWAQLGLFRLAFAPDEELTGGITGVRMALYEFAYEYAMRMEGTPSPDYTDVVE